MVWKRHETLGSDDARNVCVNGTVRVCDVHPLQSADVETRSKFMAIQLPPEEEVKGEDLIGELLKSSYGTRKAAHNWETKWQRVIIDSGFDIS